MKNSEIESAAPEAVKAELMKIRDEVIRMLDFSATCGCGVCVEFRRKVRIWKGE